ncbi:SseB family protein [Agromyces sp. SYSU T00194]|uniref:SseB family protein n=1 Tax=Agromyces chitinivorans TaxID=3158560 RepID=UPI00339B1820
MSPATEPGRGEPADAAGSSSDAAPTLPEHLADSAGQPWAGRAFTPNTHAADDGAMPERLGEAIRRFRAREVGQSDVVDAFREARLLIPLVARLGDGGTEVGAHGLAIEKSQELAIVTVAGPDGRNVLPVFGSVAAMSAWNPEARPVPADGVRVALAAASEDTELVVLDPGSAGEFVVRRPALWAVAQSEPWRPAFEDDAVRDAFARSISSELAAVATTLEPGDPGARLAGPEVVVRLELLAGLERAELDAVLQRLAQRWAADDAIATRVDSLTVRLVTAG